MEKDTHISLETAHQFLEGALKKEETDELNRHVDGCEACRHMVDSLRHHQSIWDQWTAEAHGTAYRRADTADAQTVSEAVTRGLRSRLPAVNPLSEMERRRLQKQALSRESHTGIIEKLSQEESADDWMLLAAAPQKRGSSSSSLGLAVEEKSGGVFPVTVSAWVGEDILDKGQLSVVGAQVESRSRDGMEYKTTAPLTLLKEKLSKRFRTIPWLNHLNLHKREVYVELHNPQYFDKADSLLLAIIMAVSIAAAESKGSPEDLVFSADVDMQGNLTDVGRIHEKAGYIVSAGRHRLVLSPGNYREVSAAVNKHKESAFLTFSTVGEIFDFLKLRVKKENAPLTGATPQVQKATRSIPWKSVGIVAVIAALLSVAGLFFLRAQRIEPPPSHRPEDSPTALFKEEPFKALKVLSASASRADLEAAVQMGLDVKPSDPLFKEAFIRISKILMDRVNNRQDAIQTLGHYVRYVELLQGSTETKQALADTIDPAKDLMVRYGLENHRFHGEPLGSLISKIFEELGIEK